MAASSSSSSAMLANPALGGGDHAGGKAPQKLCCDACDGPHPTEDCPVYKKPRGYDPDTGKQVKHPDAARRTGLGATGLGGTAGNFRVAKAQVVRQPGDGSCLFHAMAHGLPPPAVSASTLRKKISSWIAANPTAVIAGNPIKDWVLWDTGRSPQTYAAKMARAGVWGGGIEMAATSHLFEVDVHVYEREAGSHGGFKRISCFDFAEGAGGGRGGGGGGSARGTVSVLYGGGVHFDALVLPPGCLPPRGLSPAAAPPSSSSSALVGALPLPASSASSASAGAAAADRAADRAAAYSSRSSSSRSDEGGDRRRGGGGGGDRQRLRGKSPADGALRHRKVGSGASAGAGAETLDGAGGGSGSGRRETAAAAARMRRQTGSHPQERPERAGRPGGSGMERSPCAALVAPATTAGLAGASSSAQAAGGGGSQHSRGGGALAPPLSLPMTPRRRLALLDSPPSSRPVPRHALQARGGLPPPCSPRGGAALEATRPLVVRSGSNQRAAAAASASVTPRGRRAAHPQPSGAPAARRGGAAEPLLRPRTPTRTPHASSGSAPSSNTRMPELNARAVRSAQALQAQARGSGVFSQRPAHAPSSSRAYR